MALSPLFTISNDCNWDALTFTETTGAYDVSTNIGGYGTPNAATGDVTATTLAISNLTSDVDFDSITTISASSSDAETEILLTDLTVEGVAQFTTNITDGVYEFIWTVVASGVTYTYTVRKLFLPELCGMLNEKALTITSCKCKDAYANKWLYGFALVKSLEGSAICGDLTAFSEDYDEVYNYLYNLKCNC